jgi:predicted TIM-barrel fold metal-dependent hydrolase
VIFGTDAPPLTVIKGDGIKMVRDLKLPPADEAKVFSGNARKLLKIN